MTTENQITVTKDLIQGTETFKALDKLQQSLILKKDSFELIKNGYNVSGFHGLKHWKNEFHPSSRIYGIVKELHWKTTATLPEINQFVLFSVNKSIRINNKTKELIVEKAGHFTDQGFFSDHQLFNSQQVIKWQNY